MPLDDSFDYLISVMNRRNIARLSNGSQFPITIVCSAPSALLTSPAWGFFSSLRREVSSHLSGVRYFVRVLRPWGLPHPLDVRCFARLFRPWGLPHPLDVRCSYVHLAIWALLTSSAWGIRLITHPFSVSWSTFVATCVVLTRQWHVLCSFQLTVALPWWLTFGLCLDHLVIVVV